MSAVADVGDAVELTFNTATGATVAVSWYDPDLTPVIAGDPVTETPAGSGQFPYTFLPTAAGMWTAEFTSSGAATNVERYYVRAVGFTGPPPLAAIADVTSQFGALTRDQEAMTGWLLRAASKMVRGRFPLLDAQLAAGTIDRDVAALAVANMVLRVLRNPVGMRSESVGPFTRTFDTSVATGLLRITDAELALLAVLPDVGTPTVGTIMARPGLAPTPVGLTDEHRWHRHRRRYRWGWR